MTVYNMRPLDGAPKGSVRVGVEQPTDVGPRSVVVDARKKDVIITCVASGLGVPGGSGRTANYRHIQTVRISRKDWETIAQAVAEVSA